MATVILPKLTRIVVMAAWTSCCVTEFGAEGLYES